MKYPSLKDQIEYWNNWVKRSQVWEDNPDNARRAAYVLKEMVSIRRKDLNILDVGCGSGWLSIELGRFGKVTAVDLATEEICQLQKKHPHIEWVGGDFLSLDLRQNHYHVVTSLETIAHVPDQETFALRIAEVMHSKGKLLLTTQNEYIWSRTKSLRPPGKGQIRNWPSRERLIGLFEPYFNINDILTCAPGGDQGLPGLFNSRIGTAVMRRLFGREKWVRMRESWGWGRSLFLIGTRK